MRLLLSLLLAGILLIHSWWFFGAMFLMAGAFVLTGISGGWRDWFIWVGMLVGFALFADLRAGMGPTVEVRTFFHYAIQLETLGGLLAVPTIWLQEHLQSDSLDALATAVYISFFVVPQVVVVYLWRTGGPFPRYVAAACLLFAVALVFHFLLPTAPPWMASEEGLIPPMDRIAVRVLSSTSATLTEGGYQASANDVAAMPSVHQGLTVLAMIALAKHDPRTRWTGWVYSVLMLFAITYLGEHYAVDGVVGAAIAWWAWRLVGARGVIARRTDGSGVGRVPIQTAGPLPPGKAHGP
ncbi:MAG: phosphatase PAP2 family protein [Gemmatimonadota bacterium]